MRNAHLHALSIMGFLAILATNRPILAADATQEEWAKLQGPWTLQVVDWGDGPQKSDGSLGMVIEGKSMKLILRGETMFGADGPVRLPIVALNPAKHQMDYKLTREGKEVLVQSLYRLEGDTLVHWVRLDLKLPEGFNPGKEVAVSTYKRGKPVPATRPSPPAATRPS